MKGFIFGGCLFLGVVCAIAVPILVPFLLMGYFIGYVADSMLTTKEYLDE